MADIAARRLDLHVAWGPVIAGSFISVALVVVLGFFGAAFAAGGMATLAGIWMTLTPLLATFIGAGVAVTLAGRDSTYLNGIMVWCVSLLAGALLFSVGFTFGAPAGTMMALSGLAALLGLCGAIIGAAVGSRLSARATYAEARRSEEPGEELYRGTTVAPKPPGERPEIRH